MADVSKRHYAYLGHNLVHSYVVKDLFFFNFENN